MPRSAPDLEITRLLRSWRDGDETAFDQLIPLVYDRLRVIAARHLAREQAASVQTRELVHLAYEHLVRADVAWQDRVHFFAVAARVMRRLLIDQARARQRLRRGGDQQRVTLTDEAALFSRRDPEILDLEVALEELAARDKRKARIVEYFFFGGMTCREIAASLEVSLSTIERDLQFSRAWLRSRLSEPVP